MSNERKGMSDERKGMSDERRTHLTRCCNIDGVSCKAMVDTQLVWVGSRAVKVRLRVEGQLPERLRDIRVRTSG